MGWLAGRRPSPLGIVDGRLRPCPSSPNCVCSDATQGAAQIEPLRIQGDPTEAWRALCTALAAMPGTRVVSADDTLLHAECSTSVLGFVDDVECHLRPAEGIIAVRSASRLGYSDLGLNRRRIETLRTRLADAGRVRPSSA